MRVYLKIRYINSSKKRNRNHNIKYSGNYNNNTHSNISSTIKLDGLNLSLVSFNFIKDN